METTKRSLLKSFNCLQCNLSFRKCVNAKEHESNCPTCDLKCKETPHQISLADKMRKLMSKQKSKRSPFTGSVKRSQHHFNKMFNTYPFDVLEDFFIDNYSSNFTSNFQNPMTRIVFVKSQKINEDIKALSPMEIDQLCNIEMNELYCKAISKDNGNNTVYEYPTCLICLRDIVIGANAIVINCGHVFHSDCIIRSLEKNGVCPVCQYNVKDSIGNNQEKDKDKTKDKNKDKEIMKVHTFKQEHQCNNGNGNGTGKNDSSDEEITMMKRVMSGPLMSLLSSTALQSKLNINIYGEQEAIIL